MLILFLITLQIKNVIGVVFIKASALHQKKEGYYEILEEVVF